MKEFRFKTPIKNKRHNKFAFTLAEVLITLGIIGVVASLTIPQILQNAHKKDLVVKFNKIYSAILNATNQIIAEEGDVNTWNWNGENPQMEEIADSYKKHLNILKACSFNDNKCYDENTWKTASNALYNTYYSIGDAYKNVLQDGTYIKFLKCGYAGKACTSANIFKAQTLNKIKMIIVVNLDGDKPPNKMGQDVFYFWLSTDGKILVAEQNIDSNCINSNGVSCSAKVLKEGAINYN